MRTSLLPCLTALVLCLALSACGGGSGQSPQLLVVTPKSVTPSPILRLASRVPCHLPPDPGSRRSHFTFAGPCAFTVTAPVRCVHRGDDFYAYINRSLPRGFHLYTIINVEHYSHPKVYAKLTEVYLEIIKNLDVYSWGQHAATAQVAVDQRHLTLQYTEAHAWLGTNAVGTEQLGGTLACRGA